MTSLVCLASCAPRPADKPAEVVKYEFTPLEDGAYNYAYELSDGSYKNEDAFHLKGKDGNDILKITGEYGYKDADGQWIRITYTSDETGYHASGDHVPPTGTGVDDEPPPDVQLNPALIASLAG